MKLRAAEAADGSESGINPAGERTPDEIENIRKISRFQRIS
jgi:hypothetical protein